MLDTLQIQKLNVQYNLTRLVDNPANIRRRLDQIAGQLLAQTLEHQLAQLADRDDALYFIDHLQCDLHLNLSHNDDRQLAAAWAGALYANIQRSLSQPGVVCFRDRSAFIASFLEDLLHGRAWDCWYYAEFSDLQSVSVGQAALRVLTTDGDVGRDALMELARRDSLDRLLTRLTDAEIDAIAQQCLLPSNAGAILPNTCEAWIRGLRSLLSNGIVLTSVMARDMTRLYLGLLRQRPELGPDVNLAQFIHDLLHLHQTITEMGNGSAFLSQLATDNWSNASHFLGRRRLQPLLKKLEREVAGSELVGLLQDLQSETSATPTQRIRTAFGGLFLLVGAIADLDLYRFLQTCPYPAPEGIAKANLLIWLIALQCLGKENLEQAQRDRGVLAFAGLVRSPAPEWLENYAAQLTSEMHERFAQELRSHCQQIIHQPGLFEYQRSLSHLPEPSEWLSLHNAPDSPLLDRAWNDALGVISAIALQGFAVKLGALSGSSPSYLSRNFLESEAEIWASEETITIHFLTCSLQMVLKMAGFEHFRWQIPWFDSNANPTAKHRPLIFKFD